MLVQRSFEVGVSQASAWTLLSMVERWPEWAPHIKQARLIGGELGPTSSGNFSFQPVGSGSFEMTSWEPPTQWTWVGKVLGLTIEYQHTFEGLEEHRSRLVWTVALVDAKPGLRSTLFARAYSRNIDRAWPKFVEWAETARET